MRRFAALIMILLVCALPCMQAFAVSGQLYTTFVKSYSENVQFINECEGRHLLPLVIASATTGAGDGRMYYQIFGDVLSMTIRTDPSDTIIERCELKLTAPAGMEYGNAIYNDFTISAYQCYALQMAMDSRATPYERYGLVSDTNQALKNGNTYEVQTGVYTMHVVSENGVVTIVFENTTADPIETPAPEETPVPEDSEGSEDAPAEDTDEGAGMG